jgi:acyl-CoA synthetase (AMP-forming)/AMP-acid ligase II
MNTELLAADLLGVGATRAGDRGVALAGDGWTVSFAELRADAGRWATVLHDAEIGYGDRIAVLAANGPSYLSALYGASLRGAAVVLLNTRLDADSVRYQLEDSDARLVIVDPEHQQLALQSGAYDVPTITLDAEQRARLERVAPAPTGRGPTTPDEPFIQLYTSGTTGRPKGCVLSQRAWAAASANVAAGLRLTDRDVYIGSGPFFHVAGLGVAMSVLSVGGRVVVGATKTLEESWELVARHGVTIGSFVGGKVMSAARHPLSATHAGTVRVLFGQAGKLKPAEHEELSTLVAHAAYAGIYGSTEAGNFVTVSSRAEEMARPGTIGRPLPGFSAGVVGGDDRLVEAGEVGELVLHGASIMSEYWRLPEATAEVLRTGWLHTGDMMRMDDAGYLYMLDRAKDMVKTGGENVYSVEVEQVLRLHPAVTDCAVVGVPDDRWGEGVKAVVVAPAGVDPEALDAWCLERLAAYKRPRWYELVDALPSNGAKVDKQRLRAEHDPRRAVRLRERDR